MIIHFHLRPGGVRRIIELATPHLVKGLSIEAVTLVAGESADAHWEQLFRDRLKGISVELQIEPVFGYLAEQKAPTELLARQIREVCRRLVETRQDCVIWAHNLGIGRNFFLARELFRACARHHIPLIAHHHDWWFDNRWARWNELRRLGVGRLASAAGLVFPRMNNVRHVAINRTDARLLQRHFPKASAWVPNLVERPPERPAARLTAAKRWLTKKLGLEDRPVWIFPSRCLRRKNMAEAILLIRWLRPEGRLITTAGVSSKAETAYARELETAVRREKWPVFFGVLSANDLMQPRVSELLLASEAVLLTSIQEGFGLPYLEAAAAGRPLLARRLPNISPDLEQLGFRFPYLYSDILIAPELFDWDGELKRQRTGYELWRKQMPRSCRSWVQEPSFFSMPAAPVAFSRLTLTAQLEVLRDPLDHSWERCAGLNPFLVVWRKQAADARLKPTPWPKTAAARLSGPAYARNMRKALNLRPAIPNPSAPLRAQEAFIRQRLGADHLFPLLWPALT